MNERLLALAIAQTGTAVAADWPLKFPFSTQLLGIKTCGSNASIGTTLAVAGGATLAATAIGSDGNPSYLQPDAMPDYADADTLYTLSQALAGTDADDPMHILYLLIGDAMPTNICAPGERIIAVPFYQTGNAVTAAWTLEFPFPVRFIGAEHGGTGTSKNSTITVADASDTLLSATTLTNGAAAAAAWSDATLAKQEAADTAITVTLTQGAAPIDDPMVILFFAVGEGGSNFVGVGERVMAIAISQTGSATTGDWVIEAPVPTMLLGAKTCGSNANDTTLTLAGGFVSGATTIGDSGNPGWQTATTEPDYCAKDTAITATITQSGSRADDPLVVVFVSVGEG
jgi:hypothetical protein